MPESGISSSSHDRALSSPESGRERLSRIVLSRPVGVLAGAILLLIFLGCMSLSIRCKTESGDTTCQEGKVSIACGQELDVFYPIPFASPPNLEIDADPENCKIIEQKADHFRISCSAGENHWSWKARGRKCPPLGATSTAVVAPPEPPSAPPPPTSGAPAPLPAPTPIQTP